ncbi:MAG: LacI family DNA-binding transcriptional regulator [Eubacteriales bacterium]|nr:LacI family DNA-binding transcriptional regulator [Eubacteriales bacterium]
MAKRTTLADVAKVAGVTTMTVQRALKGTGGVSEEQRSRIQKIAEEMDYHPNVMASVLKKGSIRIGLVLPDRENENRYFASCLWDGVQEYAEKNTLFQIQCHKYAYEWSQKNQGIAMGRMLQECGDELDGVICMGGDDPGIRKALAELDERKVPYVFVGMDDKDSRRLCCVSASNEVAGRLAADLFLCFDGKNERGRILLTGDFSHQDQSQNALGFEKEVKERGGAMEILKLSSFGDIQETSRSIAQFLTADIGISGVYSCSARNTLAVCRAMELAERRIRAVGSDVFAENVNLMREGRLEAIIHKRHYDQAYRAMQILSEYIVKKQKPTTVWEQVMPVVVMHGNLECFMENHHRESGYLF